MTGPAAGDRPLVKGVVWDIDRTLLAGTYLESPDAPPPPDPELLAVARELARRGIVQALASKNPPEAADYVGQVTGLEFAAVQCGWGRKSQAVRRIADELGFALGALAFVDDDLMERAEVAAALPEVMVLTPEDAAAAPGWPEFSPGVLTDEGRRRGELYAQRRRREAEARAHGGSREDFLRYAGTRVAIGPAGPADLPRLHELAVRTTQFNTGAAAPGPAELAAALAAPGTRLAVARLRDRFGDDGLVGGVAVDTGPEWTVTLLVMSCRALGRGVLDSLLVWLAARAAAAGAAALHIPVQVTDRNVPLRLALTGAGFRAATPPPGEAAVFTRPAGDAPPLPDWVTAADWVTGEHQVSEAGRP